MYTISYASPANAPFAMYTIPPFPKEAGKLNLLGLTYVLAQMAV